MLCKKWSKLAKLNEKVTGQVVQFDVDRNNCQKTMTYMEEKLKQNQDKEAELNAELENMKKSLKMLNSSFSKLD